MNSKPCTLTPCPGPGLASASSSSLSLRLSLVRPAQSTVLRSSPRSFSSSSAPAKPAWCGFQVFVYGRNTRMGLQPRLRAPPVLQQLQRPRQARYSVQCSNLTHPQPARPCDSSDDTRSSMQAFLEFRVQIINRKP